MQDLVTNVLKIVRYILETANEVQDFSRTLESVILGPDSIARCFTMIHNLSCSALILKIKALILSHLRDYIWKMGDQFSLLLKAK